MRERLPDRRASEVMEFNHIETNGNKSPFTSTVGFYPDGRIGEMFIYAQKSDSAIGLICHDAAVLISIALQCGATIDELRASVARTAMDGGKPQSIIGTALDVLAVREAENGEGS